MVDARGHVPRRAHVPLHVGVEGEKLAAGVEGDVVLIAEAAGEKLDALAVGIGFADVAAGREDAFGVAIGVPHAGDEMILADGDGPRVGERRGDFRVVAGGEVERLSIRREDHAMHAVLSAAVAHLAKQFGLVELVVAIRVAQAPEPFVGHFVVHHVEAVEGEKQPVRAAERLAAGAIRQRERLHFHAFGRAERRDGHAVEPAVLVAHDEPALRVLGHGNPRALLRFRHRVDQLDFETGGHRQRLGIGGGTAAPRLAATGKDIAPRGSTEFAARDRPAPVRRGKARLLPTRRTFF